MADEQSQYQEARTELCAMIQLAGDLSNEASFRHVSERRLEHASHIFTKICLHAISALRLSPTGLAPATPSTAELWDLSSICAITRALVDAYFAMYYIAVDPIEMDEHAFREAVWQYHGERNRLMLLQARGCTSPEVERVEIEVGRLKDIVLSHGHYMMLHPSIREKVRCGHQALYLTNTKLAKRAGISENYYKATYCFLSCYVHTFPFATSQLALSRAGDPRTLHQFKVAIQYCLGFLSISIRDFHSLFPDVTTSGHERTEAIVDDWIYIVGHCFPQDPPECAEASE